jgi:hypothetical protein
MQKLFKMIFSANTETMNCESVICFPFGINFVIFELHSSYKYCVLQPSIKNWFFLTRWSRGAKRFSFMPLLREGECSNLPALSRELARFVWCSLRVITLQTRTFSSVLLPEKKTFRPLMSCFLESCQRDGLNEID